MGSLLRLLLLLVLLREGSLQQDPQYKIEVSESVAVQEGLCVLVTCSFFYPWTSWSSYSTFIYWFRDGDNELWAAPVATNNPNRAVKPETEGRFQVLRGTTNNCSLTITGARKQDQGAYFFRVERGSDKRSYKEKKLNLWVTAQPDILFGKSLQSGHPTNLTCVLAGSCKGTTPQFSWEGDALDSLDPKRWSSSVISFTPRAQDHGRNVTCRVTVPGTLVNTQRTIRLNVSYAPQNLTIRSFRNDTGSPHPCTCTKEEQQQGSWPLVLTLLRGGLMGAGFLLTYGLTWLYYTRCPGSPRGQN